MANTPPNQSTAQTESATESAALEATSLANFINESCILINNNIQMGLNSAYFTLPDDKNLKLSALRTYYEALGYSFTVLNPATNPYDYVSFFGFYPDYNFYDYGYYYPFVNSKPMVPRRIALYWGPNAQNCPYYGC